MSVVEIIFLQHGLLQTMDIFHHVDINSPDPRDLTLESRQNYRTLPSHYFFWRPHSAAPVIHLLIFYRRGDYLWHAAAVSPKAVRPPVNESRLVVGKHAGSIERWGLSVVARHASCRKIWKVLSQNTISEACYIVAIHHSGPEPSYWYTGSMETCRLSGNTLVVGKHADQRKTYWL